MGKKTVEDFGDQWTRFPTTEGYDETVEQLEDCVGSLLDLKDLKGKRVAEIGTGQGRIVKMFFELGASFVVALEPSDAMDVTMENTKDQKDNIHYVRGVAEELPADSDLDYVFSIGVLHHIEDPAPGVRAAYEALKPGGSLVIWIYGHEGNGLYLALAKPLRTVTTRLPDWGLVAMSYVLEWTLRPYIFLAKYIRVPMRRYLLNIFGRLTTPMRRVCIFDQLNPQYAKYYKRDEAHDLVASAGFEDVKVEHRFGYSWAVKGTKSAIRGSVDAASP